MIGVGESILDSVRATFDGSSSLLSLGLFNFCGLSQNCILHVSTCT